MTTETETEFLNITKTVQRAGISRARIYILAAEGRFPKQVVLSAPGEKRRVAWRAVDVDAWKLGWATP